MKVVGTATRRATRTEEEEQSATTVPCIETQAGYNAPALAACGMPSHRPAII
jgi:hypothetical protein